MRRQAPLPVSDSFDRLRRAHIELEQPVSVGVSNVCQGEAAFADGFVEAQQALLGTASSGKPAVLTYEEPRRVQVPAVAVDEAFATHCRCGLKLADYDVSASPARSHAGGVPVRHGQRDIRGPIRPCEHASPATAEDRRAWPDLRRDDWLLIEIAVKMVKLRQALGAAKAHT